ncbi:hypothetical protein [Succinivibrio dextrinosolvens]|uniref:hypothetical protein n=1 Tax=Succinivibrio dextrinosolvens TaxID=83771 RepID=UPI0013E94C03|nr:hypothetical protein [Succinivibrio dextrinosolvens]
MTDRQRFRTKPVIPDHNLFYRRVKFLCIHSSFAGEQNIDLQMSHGTAVRLKKRITELNLTVEQVLSLTPSELIEKYFSNDRVNSRKFIINSTFAVQY